MSASRLKPMLDSGVLSCPTCGENISRTSAECPRCRTPRALDAEILRDPPTPMLDRPWVLLVLILHLGLLGIPVYWKSHHSLSARIGMVVFSIVYTIFAVWVIAWGLRQIATLF